MRKTLFALLGLVAIGMWAVPAIAGVALGDPPKVSAPIPLENRAGAISSMANGGNDQATLSGTLIKQASATTAWYLYPGACIDRAGAPGTWIPRTTLQADSLDSYTVGTRGGYGAADLSLVDRLTHIVDSATPVLERPAIPTGSRAIWMGKFDPNWVVKVGYPNLTNQMIYIDLESDRTPIADNGTDTYTITMKMNLSLEQGYDFAYFIGGGDGQENLGAGNGFGDEDPLGNARAGFDAVRATGVFGDAHLKATFHGSLAPTTVGLTPFVNGQLNPSISGSGAAQPTTVDLDFRMRTDSRALYILITADCLFSSEDGLWAFGNGVILDDIMVSDTANPTPRTIYAEQTAAGGTDGTGGDILVADPITGTNLLPERISARVFPGKGALWAIQAGSPYTTTADACAFKSIASDHFFLGVDPGTKFALPGQFNSVVTCTLPVPVGTADITAVWGEFLNMPRSSGYVQDAEYRFYKGGSWSNWLSTRPSGFVVSGVIDTWAVDGNSLAAAVQADSVQVRYNIRCIPQFAADRQNCDAVTQYAVLYDNLLIQVTTGVPAPVFGIFSGSVAQSTFVDGTMTGLNCTVTPCWPGVRGTDLQTTGANADIKASAVKDNLNSPLGDSLTMSFVTGLRKNGMGINWQFGYDRTVGGGLTPLARTNGSFNPAFDTPRAIYRLYDPAANVWSPWDSTALDASNVSVSGDTVVIDSEYRLDWPPRDKVGTNLPAASGPWLGTINGQAAYNNLKFLPRGVRLQYYFKAVDIDGGRSYQFSTDALAREVEDLPTLPGSANIAPDIIEFNVLPRKYPVGTAGTLVAGRTDTPVLNLDGNYGGWNFGQDPVTAALRGMGIRADRYRFLGSGDQSHGIGGHEFAGTRVERLSNYFPNMEEYSIVDSLRNWYRVIIESSHTSTTPIVEEADAQVMSDWASLPGNAPNGSDGDRCIFYSGDDAFNAMLNGPSGVVNARKFALASNVFGVANVTSGSGQKGVWAGTLSNGYPSVDDRFAAQASGPGLAAPGSLIYEVDGGCPGPNRFDPLTAGGGAVAAATYPVAGAFTDVAAVAKSNDFDSPADFDQIKTVGYGYSFQFVRGAPLAIPRIAANFVRSGVQNRMQILYKFLTGCRGARGSGSPCWPCPTDATMMSNWAAATGFNTTLYGPLMPIQDFTKATGIGVDEVSAAPRANRLYGNSPNPFNPTTKISFSAAQAGKVTIRIFNVAGQLVRTLETKVNEAGPASVYWDGKSDRRVSAGSGVYYYNATFTNGITLPAKMHMVLVK